MRIKLVIAIIFIVSLFGCSGAKYTTVKQVKPINRNRYYKPGKDKRKKRVKYVRVKILKKSPEVKPPKPKVVKKKTVKSDSTTVTEEITEPINESDSTGIF